MSNSNSQTYFTSTRRDDSRRAESQQLPPLRNHLPEFFTTESSAAHTSRPSRNVSHDNVSQHYRYPQSHDSTPSTSAGSTNSHRNAQSDASYSSRSRRGESTLEHPYVMFNQDMVPQQASEHPYFPSRPARASSGGKYQCESCEERFDRPSGLETHMRSHTRERPFSCSQPGCSKAFTARSNLRRHEKTHNAPSAFEPAHDTHPYNQTYSDHYSNVSKLSKPSSSTYYTSSRYN